MDKFVVVIFPDQDSAAEGARVLHDLHTERHLTLYEMAVVSKATDESIKVAGHGLPSAAVGALLGGLIGLLGGLPAAAFGAGAGAWIGTWRDISHLGIETEFVERVRRELMPDKVAVVAEIAEDWVAPLDERMEALDGIVVRGWRADRAESELAQVAALRKAEVSYLREERARAPDAARQRRLDARLAEAQARAKDVSDRAAARLEALDRETATKVKALQAQAETADADGQARIAERIANARSVRDRRAALLDEALGLSREALD